MNIATSYFYQIRFFKRNMIPLSTALWDPKWYHDFQGPTHCYIDKNGVLNGLRISTLVPGDECNTLCRGVENCSTKNPKYCDFLREYGRQLNSLDVRELKTMLEELSNIAKRTLKLVDEPILVLMFHEKYDNPCSERVVVTEWLRDNGIDIRELSYPIAENY